MKVPDGVSLVDAAALVGDGLKMYTALHYQVHLAAGDTVLVIGAGSSWGYLTCQLAALWGAKVCYIDSLLTREALTFFCLKP